MIDLRQKRALVCGGSKGIGRACAELLARQGAAVTVAARDEAVLRQVSEGLARDANQAHHVLRVDSAQPSALRETVANHLERTGPIHILVNNTGGPPPGPVFAAKPEDFIQAITAHVLCNQVLAQTLVPGMKQAGYGRIINIISISVKTPIPDLGVSNTTRGAVASWSKTLATELAPFGITVNNVLPGYTATERLQELLDIKAAKTGVAVEEIERKIQADMPMGRFAKAEEIAAAVAFLASPEASYITGINLPVDGGRLPTL